MSGLILKACIALLLTMFTHPVLVSSVPSYPHPTAFAEEADTTADNPAEEPADETLADDATDEPADDTTGDETPADEPVDETPVDMPADDTTGDETPADEPVDETPVDMPADDTTTDEPADDTTGDETPADNVPDDVVVIPSSTGIVSITIDDGESSQFDYGAAIMMAAGQVGTIYISSDLVGEEGYMNWNEVATLALAGWDIGGHGATHIELPEYTSDIYNAEILNSFAELEARGLNPSSMATPFGAHSPDVLSTIASVFESHRGYHEIGYNLWPYNEYLLYVQQVTNVTTPAEVEAWIEQAKQDDTWLIIVLHNILPEVSADDTYAWSTASLEALMTYMNANGIEAKTVTEVLNMKASLLPNSGFESGIADGWTTDAPDLVVADTTGEGATPSPDASVKMTGGTMEASLVSPRVDLDPETARYGIRIYTDTINLSTGTLGYAIHEYDSDGNLLSSRDLGVATLGFVLDEAYSYVPSSTEVVSIELYAYLTAGSNGYAYIDNMIFFPEGEGDPLPTPNPVFDLPAALPLPNMSFDEGLASGWTTDNTVQVTADSAGHGSGMTPATSIALSGGTTDAHLFSPQGAVAYGTDYAISASYDASALTAGELGLYVDEYDLFGNWISGVWLGMAQNGTTGTLAFSYTPTSEAVIGVSLQTYLASATTGTAYVDEVGIGVTVIEEPDPVTDPNALPLPNTSFDEGLSSGWTTDNAAQVTADSDGHGTAPSTETSIAFSGGSDAHLFSPQGTVAYGTSYTVSVYYDTLALTAGELGLYVDEYDAAGNWISGKWLGMAQNGTIGTLSYAYTPSSASIASASVQTYLALSPVGIAYVDQVELVGEESDDPITDPGTDPIEDPTTDPNMLVNSSFDEGIPSGWTTDNAAQVIADAAGHGAGANPVTSLAFSGGADAHLFSPMTAVIIGDAYTVSAYYDTLALTAGELGLYVDEYDAAGNWISGKWLGMAQNGTTGTLSYAYTPSSASVAFASVQTYLALSSAGTAYVDEVTMIRTGVADTTTDPGTDPTTDPADDTTADPVATLPVTSFDEGIPSGWATDASTRVVADTDGHGAGSNAVTSVSLSGGDSNAHLFSPRVIVVSGTSYTVSAYYDTLALTAGELGLYVDEYDAAGNWISGKWLGMAQNGTTGTLSYAYTPSSASVASASVQTYLDLNPAGTAYVDEISLLVI